MVAVPLLLELVFIFVLANLLNQAENARHREYMAKQAVADANDLIDISYNQVIALLTYGMTKKKVYAQRVDELTDRFDQKLYELKLTALRDDAKLSRVRNIEQAANDIVPVFKEKRAMIDRGKTFPGLSTLEVQKQLEPLSGRLFRSVQEFTDEQRKATGNNPELESFYSEQIVRCLWSGVVLNLVIAFGLTSYYTRSIRSRLTVLMDNAIRLSARKTLNPPVAGKDEIAELDRVFRDMANTLDVLSARERAILENVGEVILSMNEQCELTAVGQAALDVLGYAPEYLLGKRIDFLMSSECMPEMSKRLESMRASSIADTSLDTSLDETLVLRSEQAIAFECLFKRSDGETVDVLLSVKWSAKERSYYCIAQNISEQKELQKLKEEFLAMVSHDLRSPLSSMHIFLELVERGAYGSLSPDGISRAKQQGNEVHRLIGMINSLLDLEKVEAGKLELMKEEICLDEIVHKSISALALTADRAGLTLEFEQAGISMYVDADRLIQVVVNLVSNAIKYSPAGETIKVEILELDDCVEVRVIDKGCGIPKRLQSSIFERFEQVKTKSARRPGSTGLGLAISKILVEEHGGEIGVISEEGSGSTFWFRLYNQVPSDTITQSLGTNSSTNA